MPVPPSLRTRAGRLCHAAVAVVALAAALPDAAAARVPASSAATAVADAATSNRSAARRSAARRAAKARRVARSSRANVTLRGSKAAVDRAYHTAKRGGVTFARSRREVERLANAGAYVRLRPSTPSYRLAGVAMPYVRPTTRGFLTTFAAEYRSACREPLTVTSAMRPTSVHLRNSVAKTVHPTGMAVDLRLPRGARCRAWMRDRLLTYEQLGVVDATEERRPAHFHVTVFRAP